MASLSTFRKVSGLTPDTDLAHGTRLNCADSRMLSVSMFSDKPDTEATLLIVWTDVTSNIIVGTLSCTLATVPGITFKSTAMNVMTDKANNVPCVPSCGAYVFLGVIAVSPPEASVTLGAYTV